MPVLELQPEKEEAERPSEAENLTDGPPAKKPALQGTFPPVVRPVLKDHTVNLLLVCWSLFVSCSLSTLENHIPGSRLRGKIAQRQGKQDNLF